MSVTYAKPFSNTKIFAAKTQEFLTTLCSSNICIYLLTCPTCVVVPATF